KALYSNDSIVFQVFDRGLPMQHVTARVYRDDATEAVEVTLPHKEKINQALTRIRFESDLVSRTFRMTELLPKIEINGGIEKDSFNVVVNNPQKVPVSWYVYQGNELLEKGSGDEIEFKSKIENREL